jgi:hypothetical protein
MLETELRTVECYDRITTQLVENILQPVTLLRDRPAPAVVTVHTRAKGHPVCITVSKVSTGAICGYPLTGGW